MAETRIDKRFAALKEEGRVRPVRLTSTPSPIPIIRAFLNIAPSTLGAICRNEPPRARTISIAVMPRA